MPLRITAPAKATVEKGPHAIQQAYDSGNLESAAEQILAALGQDDQNAELFVQLGVVLYQLDKFDKAVIALRQALELAPDHVDALNALGVVMFKLGWYAAAERFFRRTIELNPQHNTAKQSLVGAMRRVLETGDVIQPELEYLVRLAQPSPVTAPSSTVQDAPPFGKRSPKTFAVSNLEDGLSLARTAVQHEMFLDAFDLYEQLLGQYPHHSVRVLAEAYDAYQALPDQESRYNLYQSRHFNFGIKPGDKVLDIGSGHLPFPFATHLGEIAVNDGNYGRAGLPFKHVEGKPVYECNVENMPFADGEFDFVYCSHVLEHVSDPEKACRELMRVAKRGYIETPTRGKDLWLHCAKVSNHHWAVEYQHDTLIFTEYTERDLDGLQTDILLNMHCAPQTPREKAVSAMVYLKSDLVNTMVLWDGQFEFEVRRRR